MSGEEEGDTNSRTILDKFQTHKIRLKVKFEMGSTTLQSLNMTFSNMTFSKPENEALCCRIYNKRSSVT